MSNSDRYFMVMLAFYITTSVAVIADNWSLAIVNGLFMAHQAWKAMKAAKYE